MEAPVPAPQSTTADTGTAGNDAARQPCEPNKLHEPPRADELSEQPEGVRQRRNREVRERIHLAALELGEARGVSAVTVAEIAAEAGISRRSFFRYFKSKEDAVLSGHGRYLEAAGELPLRVTHVSEALGAIERIGDAVLEREGLPELTEHRRIAALIEHDPAIRAHAVAQDRMIADVFRDRLAQQLPGEDRTTLELIADLGVTVWRHGWLRWSAQRGSVGAENSTEAPAETPAESHREVRRLFRAFAGD